MDIRQAQASDAEEACIVTRRSIVELCIADHRGDEATIRSWLAKKTVDNMRSWIGRSYVFVAIDHGRIVGVGAVTQSGQLTLNYVSPDSRFSGVSKALVRRLEEEALKRGIRVIALESSVTAQKFYHSLGYQDAGPPTKGYGLTLCQPMKKTL